MRRLIAFLIAAAAGSAGAQGYVLSGKATVMEWAKGSWNGMHSWRNVYCLTFPKPEEALRLRQALFNERTIYMTDVAYPGNLFALVTVTRVPKDQTPQDVMQRIVANERSNEALARKNGLGYAVSEFPTDFGPTLGIVMTNPGPGDRNGPFPMVRPFLAKSDRLLSMSVHRLFMRGADRFEIAVLQAVRQPPAEDADALAKRLTGMADEMLQSLQKCTAASMPLQ